MTITIGDSLSAFSQNKNKLKIVWHLVISIFNFKFKLQLVIALTQIVCNKL